jgi:hypothetical protein
MGTEQDDFDSVIEAEETISPTEVSETVNEAPLPEPAAQEPPPGEKQPEAAQGAAPPAEQPPQPQPHLVPLKELLDTRERAQAAEREREDLKRQLQEFTRRQQAEQAKPPELPDIFEKPQEFVQNLTQTFEQRLAAMQLENNLQLAQVKHGDTFDKAYDAFIGACGTGQNPALYHQIMRAPSPGDAMVQWFKRDQVLREVGDDPLAYRTRLQDELIKDPAFVAKVLETARAQAGQPQNGSRPQNVTRLPSLNRQTAAATAHAADDGDDSDEAIFDSVMRDSKGRYASR